ARVEVEQADQADTGWPAVVEQLVQRRADGAATHQYVIDDHQVLPFDLERQLGRANQRVQAVLGKVIPVEGNVENAQRLVLAAQCQQGLGYPDAAGADADEAGLLNAVAAQVQIKRGSHFGEQLFGVGQGHEFSLMAVSGLGLGSQPAFQ